MAKLAGGQGLYFLGGIAIGNGLDFKGDITNPQDRYNHGMTVVTNFYKQFKSAIDPSRSKNRSKSDPTAGGRIAIQPAR